MADTVGFNLRGIVKIDPEDEWLLDEYNWWVRVLATNEGGKISLEQAITGRATSTHRNGNDLDFRRSNLDAERGRPHSRLQKGDDRPNTSGFKGVSFHRGKGHWRAVIGGSRDGMAWHKHLGLFDDPAEAARAYDRAAVEEWGDRAITNAMMGLLTEG